MTVKISALIEGYSLPCGLSDLAAHLHLTCQSHNALLEPWHRDGETRAWVIRLDL